ncbi:hypothetical protein [Plantactinospora endophytica]|uniref:Anti-sigma factor n=1 Tax=Plantactinospora endophytica TaxID=673535 RepID=A0ABQ4E1A7_9ACTN|nr:hypothetical protein [Plantactinospora endophytica]GIG88473.1 hypothetical protein Pen02_34090 [Plantactinospora endophytica]
MRHPTDGTLRRLVDEPAGVADADREHVTGCPQCLSGLATARRDAAVTSAVLDVEVTADVEAGWQRLSHAVATAEPRRTAITARVPRWGTALRRPVIAGVAVVALLTGATAAAAANWLPIFRTERIAPITVTHADLLSLPDLSAYGEAKVTEVADVRAVADAAAAQKVTGLTAPRVAKLPRGVTGQPTYHVGNRVSATFTFSTATAAQTAASAGKPLPPPPPGLDGSPFRMTAGPGLAAVWSQSQGRPAMIVGRVVAPTVYSSGIPFETARDYLLSLPGLPADVASQLRGFTDTGTTLPLIVKTGRETSFSAEVDGAPATVLHTRDGALAAVFWVKDGIVNAVAGSLSTDEVLSVARGLRWDR